MVLSPGGNGRWLDGWGVSEMAGSEHTSQAGQIDQVQQAQDRRRPLNWATRYQRQMVLLDGVCGLLAGLGALLGRFPGAAQPVLYVAATAGLPVLWVSWVAMFGGYDTRFIGHGSEEFRRGINSAISLMAAGAIASYAWKLDFARGYVLIALPGLAVVNIVARYAMRKHLHRQRERGLHIRRVTAVGHASAG